MPMASDGQKLQRAACLANCASPSLSPAAQSVEKRALAAAFTEKKTKWTSAIVLAAAK